MSDIKLLCKVCGKEFLVNDRYYSPERPLDQTCAKECYDIMLDRLEKVVTLQVTSRICNRGCQCSNYDASTGGCRSGSKENLNKNWMGVIKGNACPFDDSWGYAEEVCGDYK